MITQDSISSYTASIYTGLKDASTKEYKRVYYDVFKICQEYCDSIGWCVTLEKVCYIYKGGQEMGIKVGIIQYPRFAKTRDRIKSQTLELAEKLLIGLEQCRVTIVFPNETIMLTNIDKVNILENKNEPKQRK